MAFGQILEDLNGAGVHYVLIGVSRSFAME